MIKVFLSVGDCAIPLPIIVALHPDNHDTAGYDPVAVIRQVLGGAHLVCFTTVRGSVFGCKPAPSIELATNTPMYRRMWDDMDVNCGTIPGGDESLQGCSERIFNLILRTVSGKKTKSEAFDFGASEFAPWVIGATIRQRGVCHEYVSGPH